MSEYEIVRIDLEKVKRKIAKFPSRTPTKVESIPVPQSQENILRMVKGHAVWLVLTYGADLLSYVSPFASKAWKRFVKWRFNWESKDLPF